MNQLSRQMAVILNIETLSLQIALRAETIICLLIHRQISAKPFLIGIVYELIALRRLGLLSASSANLEGK